MKGLRRSLASKNTVLILAVSLITAAILLLLDVQIIHRSRNLIEKRPLAQTLLKVPPARGRVLDSRGLVLAETERSLSIYAYPIDSVELYSVATRIGRVLGMREPSVISWFRLREGKFRWIVRGVLDDTEQTTWLDAARCDDQTGSDAANRGLYARYEPWRVYSYGENAAHIVGRIDNHTQEATRGVEKTFDSVLSGDSGEVLVYRSARSGFVVVREILIKSPRAANDVILTVDLSLQNSVELALRQSYHQRHFNSSGALIMNARTGFVRAMALYSSLDDDTRTATNTENCANMLVCQPIEALPFLYFLMAVTGMEHRLLPLNYPVTESKTIMDHLLNPDVIDHRDIMQLIEIVGKPALRDCFDPLRLSLKTGLALPEEIPSQVNWDTFAEHGYGVRLTLIQIARVTAMLVNGGHWIQPVIVDVGSKGEATGQSEVDEKRRPFLESTSSAVRTLLSDWWVANGSSKPVSSNGCVGAYRFPLGSHLAGDRVSSACVGFVQPYEVSSDFVVVVVLEFSGFNLDYVGTDTVVRDLFTEIVRATQSWASARSRSPGHTDL